MPAALVEAAAPHDVATAVARLTAALRDRGITVFATIDHAAGARAVGLELADEVVVVFGSPAGGTPVLQADPRAGIDLPLRVLVWADAGSTRVAYRDPAELAGQFDLAGATDALGRLRALLDQLVAAAVASD
jgi:uncharacterized protein (DUF302 family)